MKAGEVAVGQDKKTHFICEGEIVSPLKMREWGAQADLRLLSCSEGKNAPFKKRSGKVRLILDRADSDLLYGDRIRFRARFYPPREFKNPGGFSYRNYLLVHGIVSQGKVYGRVERLSSGVGVANIIERMRRKVAFDIAENVGGPERGVVTALANGDKDEIDGELRDIFSNTGLAHLLAISGMNVGYVSALIYFVSRFLFGFFPALLLRVPRTRLAAAITLPASWGYVMLTGQAISAVRAAIMLSVFLIGVIIGRRQDILSTLAASVVIILIVLPLSILDVSFQLSVAAVAGIILIMPVILNRFSRKTGRPNFLNKAKNWGLSLVFVTVAAGLATAPLVAYHFKFFSFAGFVANLVAVPMTGIILSPVVAVASGVTIISSTLAAPIWKLTGISAELFIDFAKYAAEIGRPFLFHFAPNAFEVSVVYVALVAVVFVRKIKYKTAAVVLAAAIIVLPPAIRFAHLTGDKLEINVIDVGQGEAILVRFPDGEKMLIDGGGLKGSDFDVGKSVVAPILWRLGVHRLDFAILTHPHYDHYHGLGSVAELFKPEFIWTNGREAPEGDKEDWENFLARLEKADVAMVEVSEAGIEKMIGGVGMRVYRLPWDKDSDFNNTSLVVDMRYGNHRFIFTGDLSEDGEKKLIKIVPDLSADFLKVGHHGSADASSMDFVLAVHPRLAVISAGEGNFYDLPHKATLSSLKSIGAKILRTDKNGMTTIESDGKEIEAKTTYP